MQSGKAKPTRLTQQLNIVQPSLGGSQAIRSNCLETHPCKAEKAERARCNRLVRRTKSSLLIYVKRKTLKLVCHQEQRAACSYMPKETHSNQFVRRTKSSLLICVKRKTLQPAQHLKPQNIMQQQTDGSLQQEAVLALRDPPLQFTWPSQQPQSAKYYAKADRWFSPARSNTCTKRPTLAIHLACSATSSSEILCNNRQMVLFSKKQYLH